MRGLKDKVAIVAGAAPGNIGGATAVRLAEEGMAVVAADLNEAAAQSVVDEIRGFGSGAASRPFDPSLFTPMPPELAVDGVTLVRSGLVNEETQPGPFLTTFRTAGDYPYFCAIHIGVTGVVHVGTPSAESDTPPTRSSAVSRRKLGCSSAGGPRCPTSFARVVSASTTATAPPRGWWR